MHMLAHAASGYQKVLEENRRLYNQVQDLKGSFSTSFISLVESWSTQVAENI